MRSRPTLFKLLGAFVGTITAISTVLGRGFRLVGSISGVVLGVLVGTITGIAVIRRRSTRAGGALPGIALPLTFAVSLLAGLLATPASVRRSPSPPLYSVSGCSGGCSC